MPLGINVTFGFDDLAERVGILAETAAPKLDGRRVWVIAL